MLRAFQGEKFIAVPTKPFSCDVRLGLSPDHSFAIVREP